MESDLISKIYWIFIKQLENNIIDFEIERLKNNGSSENLAKYCILNPNFYFNLVCTFRSDQV